MKHGIPPKKKEAAEATPSPESGGVEHTEDKRDALTQSDKADHNRDDSRQHTGYLGKNTLEHISGYDSGQGASIGSSLKTFLLSFVLMAGGSN